MTSCFVAKDRAPYGTSGVVVLPVSGLSDAPSPERES